jgi:neutral amino acid transport system permease protein
MAVASILGLLIGLSTLRLREDYLAIVTIGVSEIVRLVALNEEWLTRGAFGVQRYTIPLEGFNPNWFSRIVMVGLLTVIVGLGFWHMWRWIGRRLKQISVATLAKSAIAMAVYLVSLGLLVYGAAEGTRLLRDAEVLQPWVTGVLLLVAIAAIGLLYAWMSRHIPKYVPHWSLGLTLISALFVTVGGLWIYAQAASALYNYDRNPVKTGLMLVSVVLLALVFWQLEWLVRSPWGRVLKSIREDEEVAKALGKNVFWYKLQSLMIGGIIAGLSGAIYAWQLTVIYPDNFQPLTTFNAWTIVVLGGAGNNVGTLLGAVIFWAYETLTRFYLRDYIPFDDARLGAFRVMVIGLILMVLMVWRPQGILGKKEELTLTR